MVTMAIEIFQLPQKVGLWHFFQKPTIMAFQKHVTCPLFSRPKTFDCHLTYPHCQMVTEFFQSPSNTPTPLDGDQIFLITNHWCRCVRWQPKTFGHHLTDHHRKMATKFF
jgi:hypothetical protein